MSALAVCVSFVAGGWIGLLIGVALQWRYRTLRAERRAADLERDALLALEKMAARVAGLERELEDSERALMLEFGERA